MKSKDFLQPRGWWWETMGFTRIHLCGVFLTEGLLTVIGIGVIVAALFGIVENTVAWLLVAVCIFLLQLGVVLCSVLSLLFYLGSRLETTSRESEKWANAA